MVNGNLKSENSQDNAQKPQRICKFINLATVQYVQYNQGLTFGYSFHQLTGQCFSGEFNQTGEELVMLKDFAQ